ncbi:hypothetical protein L1887_57922 [Cichorium endivia]|nr:hypothetical protein L1887_57922 [Cichorium endivia]
MVSKSEADSRAGKRTLELVLLSIVVDEDGLLAQQRAMVATRDGDRLADVVLAAPLAAVRDPARLRAVIARHVDEEVVVVKGLKLDANAALLHDLVDLAVLLARDEFAMLVGQRDLEANFKVEALDEVEIEQRRDGGAHLGFEAVDLEAVALEDDLGAGGAADVLEHGRDLRRVEVGLRWHVDVKADGQKPEGKRLELARENGGVARDDALALVHGYLEEHVAGPLNAEELAGDVDLVDVGAGLLLDLLTQRLRPPMMLCSL